jgi:hypothetical protein
VGMMAPANLYICSIYTPGGFEMLSAVSLCMSSHFLVHSLLVIFSGTDLPHSKENWFLISRVPCSPWNTLMPNSSVVAELDDEQFAATFQFNTNSSRFSTLVHSGQSAANTNAKEVFGPPCAVAGPFIVPAKELSVLASATQFHCGAPNQQS